MAAAATPSLAPPAAFIAPATFANAAIPPTKDNRHLNNTAAREEAQQRSGADKAVVSDRRRWLGWAGIAGDRREVVIGERAQRTEGLNRRLEGSSDCRRQWL
ncbi:hypothetical protein M0R45_032036 [Rubus argutus]|uniref:Uncharacterized protein n=1 Tax=Rubus argutus TaxID=59490 RepID=A0AAW1WHJ9_RUBAR